MRPVELAYQKGYRCDRLGNVTGPTGRVLALREYRLGGYPYFGICIQHGKKATVRVHRLQAFQKFGAELFMDGIEVRHRNGNANDNSYDNILIGTRAQNAMDKPKAVRMRAALIASETVRKHNHAAIIQHYSQFGWTNSCRAFGVGKSTLHFIVRNSRTALTIPRTYLERRLKGVK